MVVAAPTSNNGTPTGDGTAYTANTVYASGTALGNGYVVYKGTGANVTVTGLTNGTPYYFKIFSRLGTTWSTGVEVTTTPADVTQTTDYFRSAATGDWASNATWESSHDGSTGWMAASLTPTSAANTVTIRSGHTVTISAAVTLDQVVIENSGTLVHAIAAGKITINDGTGDDVIIKTGGVYLVNNTSQTYANHITMNGNSSFHVHTGGVIRIGNGVGGTVGTGFGGYATNTNNVWQDLSILEWNNGSNIPWSGDFFPNAPAGVVPILKTTVPVAGYGGSSTVAFTMNGILEAGAVVHIGGTTTKYIRDGINNADSVVFGANVGKVTLGNGTVNTFLLGSGPILIPDAGIDIVAGTDITLTGNKTIAKSYNSLTPPTLTLLTGAHLILGANTLELKARAASSGGHIVTNGAGKLRIDSVDNAAGAVLFPVGPSTTLYHPATVTNIGTRDDFSVNVATNAASPCTNNNTTVDVVWDIAEETPGGSDCTLSLDFTGATLGNYNPIYGGTIAHCNGAVNDYSNGTVTGNVATGSGFTAFSPFVVTSGNIALPLRLLSFEARKNGTEANLTWTTADELNVKGFEVQRSNDGNTFTTIGFVPAGNSQYRFSDRVPAKGINLYRLRMVDFDGRFEYSKIQQVSFSSDLGGVRLYPTLATDRVYLLRGETLPATYTIWNQHGQQVATGMAGSATEINVSRLAPGNYYLRVGTASLRFVKQ